MKKFKLILTVLIVLFIILFSIIYTRPRTIEQRYSLDLSKCTEIRGDFKTASSISSKEFVITPEDKDFEILIDIFQSQKFKTKLTNIISRETKTYSKNPEKFEWTIVFVFDNSQLLNGEMSNGSLLQIRNVYGDLELYCIGDMTECFISDQNELIEDVLDIITLYSNE